MPLRRRAPASSPRSTGSARTENERRRRRARSSRSPTSRSRRRASRSITEPGRLGLEHAVLERLRVAADRGQRRLQLVADREEEGALGVLCLLELGREVVERRSRASRPPAARRRAAARAARPPRARGSPRRRARRVARRRARGASATSGRERRADETGEPEARARTASSRPPGSPPGGAGRSPRRRSGARRRGTASRARRPCRSPAPARERSPRPRRAAGARPARASGSRGAARPSRGSGRARSATSRAGASRRWVAIRSTWRSSEPSAVVSSERRVRSAPATTVTTSETTTVPAIPRKRRERSSRRDQLVPRAAHRADQLRAAELPADLADVDVDRARAAREREAPDPLEDPLAGRRRRRVARRGARRGRTRAPSARRRRRRRSPSASGGRARRRRPRAGRRPTSGSVAPEHRADARRELARRERLRDVVVGPELEPRDAVDLLVARGQHDDRQRRDRADRLAEVEAVGVRELEVEDREPDVVPLERLQPLGAARRPDDPEALALEVRADDRGDVLLVLDEQDRAARALTSARPRARGRRAPCRPAARTTSSRRPGRSARRATRRPPRHTAVRAVRAMRTRSPLARRRTSARGRTPDEHAGLRASGRAPEGAHDDARRRSRRVTASATKPGRISPRRRRAAVQPVARRRAERDRDVAAVERAEDDRGRAERLDDPALDAVGGSRRRRREERRAHRDRRAEGLHGRIVPGRRKRSGART